MTPVSVKAVEEDSPTGAYGPVLLVARPMEYPVAPVLADQASTIWLFPGVAANPLGVAGADGEDEGEGLPPPPHAANPRADRPSTGAVIPSLRVAARRSTGVSTGGLRGCDWSPRVVTSTIANPFVFIVRIIPWDKPYAVPHSGDNGEPRSPLTRRSVGLWRRLGASLVLSSAFVH